MVERLRPSKGRHSQQSMISLFMIQGGRIDVNGGIPIKNRPVTLLGRFYDLL